MCDIFNGERFDEKILFVFFKIMNQHFRTIIFYNFRRISLWKSVLILCRRFGKTTIFCGLYIVFVSFKQ